MPSATREAMSLTVDKTELALRAVPEAALRTIATLCIVAGDICSQHNHNQDDGMAVRPA